VAAVIGIVSIGEGLRRTVMGEFAQRGGANTVLVNPPREWERKDGRWVRRPWQEHLTTDDLEAVHEETDQIRAAVPGVWGSAQLRYKKASMNARFTGTSSEFNEGFSWPVDKGRSLSAGDVRYARKVCMIGRKILEDLFQDTDPIGEQIKLNGERYTVIGVLEERVRFGREEGDQVLIPYTTAQKRLTGNRNLLGITFFVEKMEHVNEVADAVRRVLRRRHEHAEEFRVETSEKQIEDVNKIIRVMKLVAGGIAGISLLVGGIGIMNIMLVSVTERTREIGIRKALGAKPRHLLQQFVVEAIILSVVGGMLGVGVGIGLGRAISEVIEHYAKMPFPSVVSAGSVALSLGLSGTIGLFFGIYPAARAARMKPVDALRYE